MSTDRPWWTPEAHADRRPFSTLAARIKSAFRAWFEEQGLHRGRAGLPAGLARQRGAPARLRTELDRPDLSTRAALSAHLARVRLQEAAGGRRGEDLRLRARVPQSRARRAARARVHHARMVSRRCGLRGADGRLRGALEARRRDGRQPLRLRGAGVTSNPRAVPARLTVAEAFARYAGIDLLATIGVDGNDAKRSPPQPRGPASRRAPTTPGPTSSPSC